MLNVGCWNVRKQYTVAQPFQSSFSPQTKNKNELHLKCIGAFNMNIYTVYGINGIHCMEIIKAERTELQLKQKSIFNLETNKQINKQRHSSVSQPSPNKVGSFIEH